MHLSAYEMPILLRIEHRHECESLLEFARFICGTMEELKLSVRQRRVGYLWFRPESYWSSVNCAVIVWHASPTIRSAY